MNYLNFLRLGRNRNNNNNLVMQNAQPQYAVPEIQNLGEGQAAADVLPEVDAGVQLMQNPGMGDAELEEQTLIYQELEAGIRQTYVHNEMNMSTEKYMELYSLVYKYKSSMSLRNKGRRRQVAGAGDGNSNFQASSLCNRIKDYLRNHLRQVWADGPSDTMGEDLLRIYVLQWDSFKFSSNVLNGYCSYINRHWLHEDTNTEVQDHTNSVYNLCLNVWKDNFFMQSYDNISNAITLQMEKERNGEIINTGLIRQAVDSFVELSSVGPNYHHHLIAYKQCYKKILSTTEIYYTNEASAFLNDEGKTMSDYLKRVETRLSEELERVGKYLHTKIRSTLIHTCEKVFILNQLNRFNDEFKVYLQNQEEHKEDLERMYLLVSRLDSSQMDVMKETFEEYVIAQGLAAIEGLCEEGAQINPEVYSKAILAIYWKFHALVSITFRNNVRFFESLDRACKKFINQNSLTVDETSKKSSELIARYSDKILKNPNKALYEREVEKALNQVVLLFNFIDDRDAFEKYYSTLLANRLILNRSASEESEISMIGKLRNVAGQGFTFKQQRMFHDMSISKGLTDNFKVWLAEQGQQMHQQQRNPLDFQVKILTSVIWNIPYTPTEFLLPEQVHQSLTKFIEFYNTRYNGRKISWLYSYSGGDITTNCFKKPYIFQASAHQIAILLIFNSNNGNDSYKVKELADLTKLEIDALIQILKILMKFKILASTDEATEPESELNEDSTLKIFKNFQHKKYRVIINIPLKTDVQREKVRTHKAIENDRRFECQAAIIRIMKSRQVLEHSALIAEVIQLLRNRFVPSVPLIKRNIDVLLQKDFLVRDDNNANLYKYVA